MNFQRGKKHEEFEMNLVPLIDVLLVIIIFLVVSATFSHVSELQINLPTAEANAPDNKPLVITIDVDASGNYLVNGKAPASATVANIAAAMTAAVGNGKVPVIVINADAKTTHQSVINVMEAARVANYTHITFATQVNAGS